MTPQQELTWLRRQYGALLRHHTDFVTGMGGATIAAAGGSFRPGGATGTTTGRNRSRSRSRRARAGGATGTLATSAARR